MIILVLLFSDRFSLSISISYIKKFELFKKQKTKQTIQLKIELEIALFSKFNYFFSYENFTIKYLFSFSWGQDVTQVQFNMEGSPKEGNFESCKCKNCLVPSVFLFKGSSAIKSSPYPVLGNGLCCLEGRPSGTKLIILLICSLQVPGKIPHNVQFWLSYGYI